MPKIAIIGAGAAGCFLAQRMRDLCPGVRVDLYEAHERPLMKVAVTGGGRCNLTNTFRQVNDLKQVYPRGHRLMNRLLHRWDQNDTMRWFEERGVPLVVQEDECVFPKSQDAMQIVQTLKEGLHIHTGRRIEHLSDLEADAVIVTTGGSRHFEWLEEVGLPIEIPQPSLFPFKLKPTGLESLMGLVAEEVQLSLAGSAFKSQGTLLLTHFGVSGPAVLRLSSYAARHLAEQDYQATLIINWWGGCKQSEALNRLQSLAKEHADRQIVKTLPRQGGQRWVEHILVRADIRPDTLWKALNPKQLNRLVNILTADTYHITGRAPHKEEFVTCGGVSLTAVDATTLESKQHPDLYLAGEVLDIDGVTGGFNLQAAWSMANAIAESLKKKYNQQEK